MPRIKIYLVGFIKRRHIFAATILPHVSIENMPTLYKIEPKTPLIPFTLEREHLVFDLEASKVQISLLCGGRSGRRLLYPELFLSSTSLQRGGTMASWPVLHTLFWNRKLSTTRFKAQYFFFVHYLLHVPVKKDYKYECL